MAIRVRVNDVTFEADTAQEAFELQRLISSEAKGKNKEKEPEPTNGNGTGLTLAATIPTRGSIAIGGSLFSPLTDRAITNFADGLNENGRKVFMALVDAYPESLATHALGEKAGVNPMSLPPIIKHIKSVAGRAGIDADLVIRRKQATTTDGSVQSQYELTKEVAEKMKPVAEEWRTG